MVRGLILPLHAYLPLPQAQLLLLQGVFSSSISLAMPSIVVLCVSPGLVCSHRIKRDTPQPPAKPAKPVTRCSYQHHPMRAQQTLTLIALKVPMLSSERGIR